MSEVTEDAERREGYRLALLHADAAIALQFLEEPQTEDDAAYDRGVRDALNAVRALSASSNVKEP